MRAKAIPTLLTFLTVLSGCPADGDWPTPAPDPYAPPVAADCGAGVAPGSVPGLERWPYLGLTATDGMTVAWGGPFDATEGRLVWGPDGTYGSSAVAEVSNVPGSVGEQIALFSARATGLQPNTEYCYGVEVGGVLVASGLRFHTRPVHPDAPVRFTALGDFGAGTEDQVRVATEMTGWLDDADLWMTLGDNAYSSGLWHEWQDNVFEPHREQLHRVPAYLVPGNHDWNDDLGLEPYFGNWFLPGAENYWSFDYGPVHFVGLDSEMGILETGPGSMVEWLEADLAAADKPWTIAIWHHPVLTGHDDRVGHLLMILRAIPVLQEHGVDLVLVGHDHFYQRFQRLRFEEGVAVADPAGFGYVISGGGGRGLYDVEPHELDVARFERHHFLFVEADRTRSRGRAIADDGEVLDEFEITK